MRLKPGGIQTVAQESITGKMLMQAGINNPDTIPTIMRLYQDDDSSILSYLDIKGLKTKGLSFETNNAKFRTVGSNHVQFAIANSPERKVFFRPNADGITFKDDLNGSSNIGKGKNGFYVWVDTNWAGYQEIIELGDRDTQLYILDDPEPDSNDTFRLYVKLWSNDPDDTVDATLLAEGCESSAVAAPAEQDFSDRGVEKYTFDGWGDAYLSLQRFKYSWSGTAKAMKVSGRWATHKGKDLFITEADNQMMRRAAKYLEFQMVFGKTTVHEDTRKVVMFNKKGREVLAGNGLMHSGDGPIKIQYNEWTKKFIQTLFMNVDSHITRDGSGQREVLVAMGRRSLISFYQLMREMGVTQNQNIEGSGAEKGINDTYAYYEIDGLRLVPRKTPWFDNERRAGIKLADGTYANEWDAFLLPVGFNSDGDPYVQLCQLRPATRGTVAGIDEGGNIASSVDGSSTHLLFQNGIISTAQVFSLYRPYYR